MFTRSLASVLGSSLALASSLLAQPTASTPQASTQQLAESKPSASTDERTLLTPEHRTKARAMIERAEGFLRARQDQGTGGWSMPKPDKDGKTPPHLPGISALVLKSLLMREGGGPVKPDAGDGAIALGEKYLLNLSQSDGGIYDKMLPSYNTALAVSALSRVDSPRSRDAVARGVAFLRQLQWSEDSSPDVGGAEAPKPITKEHIYYGGVGYGKHGRPDNSNLNIFVQALEDAGVSPGDEAVKRALVFLRRTQMDDRVNEMDYAKGSRQGGFIYATVENAQSVDGRAGQSFAGTIEETLSDGTKASRLRAYGSMTYAGFKTYLYAELPRTDVRVTAAYDWIRRNYTLSENPGMGHDGLYYYFVVFARALKAWGEPVVARIDADNKPIGDARWADELVDRLAGLQNDDGSFKSVGDRWMENDPVLITAYALIALKHVAQ